MRLALGAATLLVHLISAGAHVAQCAGGRVHFFRAVLAGFIADELVRQPLVAEITLLVCNPILQAPMRTNDEHGHVGNPSRARSGRLYCRPPAVPYSRAQLKPTRAAFA